MADTIEEELALLARVVDEAEKMGIDPWPEVQAAEALGKICNRFFYGNNDAELGFKGTI